MDKNADEPVFVCCVEQEDGTFAPFLSADGKPITLSKQKTAVNCTPENKPPDKDILQSGKQSKAVPIGSNLAEDPKKPSPSPPPPRRGRTSVRSLPTDTSRDQSLSDSSSITAELSARRASSSSASPPNKVQQKAEVKRAQRSSWQLGKHRSSRAAPAPSTANASSMPKWRRPPPSGVEPDLSKKVYCSYWIWRGECAYGQQGCLYKHEMPDRETLASIGIHHTPRWWQELNKGTQSSTGARAPAMKNNLRYIRRQESQSSRGNSTRRKAIEDHKQQSRQEQGPLTDVPSLQRSKHAPTTEINVLSRRSSVESILSISKYPVLPAAKCDPLESKISTAPPSVSSMTTGRLTPYSVASREKLPKPDARNLKGLDYTLQDLLASDLAEDPISKALEARLAALKFLPDAGPTSEPPVAALAPRHSISPSVASVSEASPAAPLPPHRPTLPLYSLMPKPPTLRRPLSPSEIHIRRFKDLTPPDSPPSPQLADQSATYSARSNRRKRQHKASRKRAAARAARQQADEDDNVFGMSGGIQAIGEEGTSGGSETEEAPGELNVSIAMLEPRAPRREVL